MSYDDTNRGAIWRNERKESDRHPDFNGNLNVEGVEYWVSAWKRAPDAKPNSPALKFSIKRKEARQSTDYPVNQKDPTRDYGQAPGVVDPAFDDEIPF